MVGRLLSEFIEEKGEWSGTASELLKNLSKQAKDIERERKEWPKQPNQLSKTLRRLAPSLRGIGIDISDTRNHEGRFFTLRKTKENIDTTVTTDKFQEYQCTPCDDDRVGHGDAGNFIDMGKGAENGNRDDRDGGVDELHPLSGTGTDTLETFDLRDQC